MRGVQSSSSWGNHPIQVQVVNMNTSSCRSLLQWHYIISFPPQKKEQQSFRSLNSQGELACNTDSVFGLVKFEQTVTREISYSCFSPTMTWQSALDTTNNFVDHNIHKGTNIWIYCQAINTHLPNRIWAAYINQQSCVLLYCITTDLLLPYIVYITYHKATFLCM